MSGLWLHTAQMPPQRYTGLSCAGISSNKSCIIKCEKTASKNKGHLTGFCARHAGSRTRMYERWLQELDVLEQDYENLMLVADKDVPSQRENIKEQVNKMQHEYAAYYRVSTFRCPGIVINPPLGGNRM